MARAEVFGFRRQPDAIGPDEIGKNLLVPSLLKAVELDRLLQLLSDSKLREQMGSSGREVVAGKFDLRKNVAQLIESYGISQPGRQ